MRSDKNRQGFTLIELSIVLVIIGLIVGGVLTGRDLIKTAETRAQISQIEKYNTAVNTFRTKFGYLPGDIPDPYASQFGFQARGQYNGEGDGNGIIEGVSTNAPYNNWGMFGGTGETAMVWVDLTTAKLIDGSFTTASPTTSPGSTIYAGGGLNNYMPYSKINSTLYVYVWSANAINYWGLSAVYEIQEGGCNNCIGSNPYLSVQQAYNIDKKIDDGAPLTGHVTAQYNNFSQVWSPPQTTGTTSTPGSSTTCYDNNSGNGPQAYSTEQSGGTGLNCALSFQFQ